MAQFYNTFRTMITLAITVSFWAIQSLGRAAAQDGYYRYRQCPCRALGGASTGVDDQLVLLSLLELSTEPGEPVDVPRKPKTTADSVKRGQAIAALRHFADELARHPGAADITGTTAHYLRRLTDLALKHQRAQPLLTVGEGKARVDIHASDIVVLQEWNEVYVLLRDATEKMRSHPVLLSGALAGALLTYSSASIENQIQFLIDNAQSPNWISKMGGPKAASIELTNRLHHYAPRFGRELVIARSAELLREIVPVILSDKRFAKTGKPSAFEAALQASEPEMRHLLGVFMETLGLQRHQVADLGLVLSHYLPKKSRELIDVLAAASPQLASGLSPSADDLNAMFAAEEPSPGIEAIPLRIPTPPTPLTSGASGGHRRSSGKTRRLKRPGKRSST